MQPTWGPFTGRQLVTMFVALVVGLVLVPGAVWAVDSFSNVAIEDPVTGAKASVDSTHKVRVGDGSGPLTVDGNVYTLPATTKSPFRSEGVVPDYNLNGTGFVVLTGPTTATLALTHLVVSNSVNNSNSWETYIYVAAGTTADECRGLGSGYARVASRNVPPGQSVVDDFTTPTVMAPLTPGGSWCFVAGAQPRAGTTGSANANSERIDYSGYVVSGTFSPPAYAPAAGANPPTNSPSLGR